MDAVDDEMRRTESVKQSTIGLTDGEESQIEPDFIEEIGNVTVAQGRDAFLSCSIAHLNDYTVSYKVVIVESLVVKPARDRERGQ